MVHTQGGAHTRRSVATAGVFLFKRGAEAGPHIERSEPKRGFLARVRVRVTVTVAVTSPLGLGVGLPLLVHIWGLPERTGQSAGLVRPPSWYVRQRPCPVYSGKLREFITLGIRGLVHLGSRLQLSAL